MRISGQQFVWFHRIGIPGVQSETGFQNAAEDSGNPYPKNLQSPGQQSVCNSTELHYAS